MTLDLEAKEALPAVRLPLNQLTWPEIARMVHPYHIIIIDPYH